MPERTLTFSCLGDTLVGVLHEPDGVRRDIGVLIIVGGPQYRVGSHRQFVLMARQLAAAGHPVFRFDCRGMGDATGAHCGFEAIDMDIRAALDAFRAELSSDCGVVLLGLCDAASAALIYASSDPHISGLVLANPWIRTEAGEAKAYVRHYYGRRLLQRSFWEKILAGRFQWRSSLHQFLNILLRGGVSAKATSLDDGPEFVKRMEHGMAAFHGPTLFLMSERDLTAREFDDLCRTSRRWSKLTARPSVQRVDVPDADHTFSSARALNLATRGVHDWLRTVDFG